MSNQEKLIEFLRTGNANELVELFCTIGEQIPGTDSDQVGMMIRIVAEAIVEERKSRGKWESVLGNTMREDHG